MLLHRNSLSAGQAEELEEQKKLEESEMKVYKSEMQNVSFLCLIIESKSDCSIFAVDLRNHLFLQRSCSPYFNLLFTCFLIIRKVHE